MLGIALNSDEILFKYTHGLHSYLRNTLLLFDANDLDKICIQATHLEARDKSRDQDPKGRKKMNTLVKKKDKKYKGHCSHCNLDGHIDAKCWKLHTDKALKWLVKNIEKKNTLASKSNEPYVIDDACNVDEKLTCMGVKNSNEVDD